jgi:hypothetical protein
MLSETEQRVTIQGIQNREGKRSSALPFQSAPQQSFPDNEVSIEQDLARWRSAAKHLTSHLSSVHDAEAERISRNVEYYFLLETAARLWLHSILGTSPIPRPVFNDALIHAKAMPIGFRRVTLGPRFQFIYEMGWDWVLDRRSSRSSRLPDMLPDISILFERQGDEFSWDCMVIIALIVYYLQTEGNHRGLEHIVIEGITIDNVGRRGILRYAQHESGYVGYRKLVVWW